MIKYYVLTKYIAIICSDYDPSNIFYTEILGLKAILEVYREERDSYKLDLALNGEYSVELLSFSIRRKDLQSQKLLVYVMWLLK
jgi:catechol 2,3-dioxygenase-like lactoylglutathione lyase family enzyme